MTSRERVGKAVNFQVPDRVPIDLGGMKASGIAAGAYHRLKKAAGHTRRDQGLGSALHDRRRRTGGAQEVPRGCGSRAPSPWMVMLLTEKDTCHELMDRPVEAAISGRRTVFWGGGCGAQSVFAHRDTGRGS